MQMLKPKNNFIDAMEEKRKKQRDLSGDYRGQRNNKGEQSQAKIKTKKNSKN